MTTPKITVITPTYNRADFLEKTIESVLYQTFSDFEYYILDDGSTDNTEDIVRNYLNDKRVKYIKYENSGEATTVNKGWQLAKGEYFTQVNSDDPILPTLFEEMVKALDSEPEKVLAYPDFYFINENDEITYETKSPDWNFTEALSNYACYPASAGTFIRRLAFSDWKTIKNSPYKHINDTEMYWKMALVGDFLHVPKTLANWRVHSGQISSKRYLCIPEVYDWYNNYFQQENLPKDILNVKETTKFTIFKYLIELINESELAKTIDVKKESHIQKIIAKYIYKYGIRPLLMILFEKNKVKANCDILIKKY